MAYSISRTAALWLFNEPKTGIKPSDAAGNVNDLVATTHEPPVVDAYQGFGRQFRQELYAFKGSEAVAGSTRLDRTMAIDGLIDFAGVQEDGTYGICCRGLGGSTAERRLFGLQLEVASGVGTLRMLWERSSGSAATIGGADFALPAGYATVAAVRRWLSASSVEVDYYVNAHLIGTGTSSHGDLAGGAGGTMLVGCIGSAGAPASGWLGVINWLRVSRDERTAEELEQVWGSVFVSPEYGYELVRQCLPPGKAYSRSLGSAVQREVMVEGDALGGAWGYLEDLGRNTLPERATRGLARWEGILRLSPRPGDSYAQRRVRALAFLRKSHGFNRNQIVEAVAEILDIDPDDLEILEGSVWSDGAGPWTEELTTGGSFSSTDGGLELALDTGDDARWTTGTEKPLRLRTTLIGSKSALVVHPASLSGAGLVDGAFAGIFIRRTLSGDVLLYGIERVSGTLKLGYRQWTDGTMGSFVELDTSPLSYHLRLYLADGEMKLARGTAPDGPWSELATVTAFTGPQSIGAFLSSPESSAAGALSIEWDVFRLWMPESGAPYCWHIFRDPGLSGSPDLAGGQLTINGMRPAHTEGSVCQSRSLLCDEPDSRCDRDPDWSTATMTLPTSRNTDYAAGMNVKSADMNEIQDWIVEHERRSSLFEQYLLKSFRSSYRITAPSTSRMYTFPGGGSIYGGVSTFGSLAGVIFQYVGGKLLGYELDADEISFATTAGDVTNPRIDLVQVKLSKPASEVLFEWSVKEGDPSATPVAETPDTGFVAWAAIKVAAGASAGAPGVIATDDHIYDLTFPLGYRSCYSLGRDVIQGVVVRNWKTNLSGSAELLVPAQIDNTGDSTYGIWCPATAGVDLLTSRLVGIRFNGKIDADDFTVKLVRFDFGLNAATVQADVTSALNSVGTWANMANRRLDLVAAGITCWGHGFKCGAAMPELTGFGGYYPSCVGIEVYINPPDAGDVAQVNAIGFEFAGA